MGKLIAFVVGILLGMTALFVIGFNLGKNVSTKPKLDYYIDTDFKNVCYFTQSSLNCLPIYEDVSDADA